MNDAPDPTLLAALTKLNEGQWVELLARVGEPVQGPAAKNISIAERAASLATRAAQDPPLRAKLDAFLGKSSRLDLILVVVQREFPGLPARLEGALRRLRGLALNIRHVDPTVEPLPNAELYVVVLGAAVGNAEVFEAALRDPEACIGLLLDPLTLDRSLQYPADAIPRLTLASRYNARFHRFAADPVAALDEPLSAWLERHPPDVGRLRPYELAYLRAREPEWESGGMRPLSGLVRLPTRGSEQRALNREDMYVSLHAGPGPWGRDEAGRAVLIDSLDRRMIRVGEPKSPLFLDELLSLPELPQSLVEGEAGSGKTVLLQHLGLSVARVLLRKALPAESRLALESPPIPVAFEAASLNPGGCADVVRCFADHLARLMGTGEDLYKDLLQGRYWLLIDALDEVPGEAQRQAMLNALTSLARQAPRVRLVLTSRPGAHSGLRVQGPLRVVPIVLMDEERRGALIARWGQEMGFTPRQIDDARDTISSLEDRFSEDQDGRSPLTNPLFCTAALLVYWQERRLPENLAELFGRLFIALCQSRTDPGNGVSAETMMRWLVRVGRSLQDSGGTTITLREAAIAVAGGESLGSTEAEDRVHRLVNATGVLRTESTDRGVVVRPWHRSFQEYLAAASLLDPADRVDATVDFLRQPREKKPGRLHDPFWTGTLRMAVGVFGMFSVDRAQAFVDAWLREAEREEKEPSAEARRREGHLLMLAASGVREYRDESFRGSDLLRALPARVAGRYAAGGVDWAWRDRVDALDALGSLGDPRLPDPRERSEGWVFVEAGERSIGGDLEAYSPLLKQQFHHGALWVRRHPVTVAEYAGFLREADPKHIPDEWGRQSLHETQPVVSVSWHDARAFCAWAQRAWKLPGAGVLDLPTSREWEAVALGARGGPYPWGDPAPGVGDASRAAYDWEPTGAGPHKAALPVGAFPAGHAGGLWDLAGNVWEWCASAIDLETNAEADCPRLFPDDETLDKTDHATTGCVLRGGSWYNNASCLRSAFRFGGRPISRSQIIGFRVVVRVPPASGLDPVQ